MPALAAALLLLGQLPTEVPTSPIISGPAKLVSLADRVEQPVELGQVKWRRDFDAGLAEAKRSDKPVLLLFQEVPGWQGCQDYGAQVLTHPLLVEAAEELFVPIAVYNNTEGDADEKVLKRYKEPAWNYQVVRVVDGDGSDLIPRLAKDWTRAAVARTMVAGLKAAKKPVPKWLQLYAAEELAASRGTERAIFGMTWFWVGEAEFGLIDGVVKTRQAWLGKKEVVEVFYDPKVVTRKKLEAFAKGKDFWFEKEATVGLADRSAPWRLDKEQKYYLLQSPLKTLPMSEAQACRVNASLDGDWKQYLTPAQLRQAQELLKPKKKTSAE